MLPALPAGSSPSEAQRLCAAYDVYGDGNVHYARVLALLDYFGQKKMQPQMDFPGAVLEQGYDDPAMRAYELSQEVATAKELHEVPDYDSKRGSDDDFEAFIEDDDGSSDGFEADLERAMKEKENERKVDKGESVQKGAATRRGKRSVFPLGSVSAYAEAEDDDIEDFIGDDDDDEDDYGEDRIVRAWHGADDGSLEQRGEARRLSPGKGDVLDFAMYLGIDPDEDRDFFWIAEECLYAPLPQGFCSTRDNSSTGRGDMYYWKESDPSSVSWEHPLDPFYKALFERLKAEKLQREEERINNRLNPSEYRKKKLKQARPQTAQALGRKSSNRSTGLNVMRRAVEKGVTGSVAASLTPRAQVKSRPQSAMAFGRRSKNKIAPDAGASNEGKKRLLFGKMSWLGDRISTADEREEENSREHGIDYVRGILMKLLPAERQRSFWWANQVLARERVHMRLCNASLYGSADPSHAETNFHGLEPSPEDLTAAAEFLGIVLPHEAHLLWIAKLALVAPVPSASWKQCTDDDGSVFFASSATFHITRQHPLDPVFALLVHVERVASTAHGKAGIFDLEEASDTSWARFYDDDGTPYYFNAASTECTYTCPWSPDRVVGAPYCTLALELYSDQDMDAFMDYVLSALELAGRQGDGDAGTSAPLIHRATASRRLEAAVLRKLRGLLDCLIEHKSKALVAGLAERDEARKAVEERRETAAVLTKHIAKVGAFG